jgi:hypothetical protein
MAVIVVGDINQWLGVNKLEIATLPTELTESQTQYVFGKLRTVYLDVIDGWTTTSNTPELIQSVISMRVAGYLYLRQYAEEASGWAAYGQYLLRESDKWLDQINSGALDLDGVDFPLTSSIAFYPDDIASEAVVRIADDFTEEVIVAAEAPRFGSMRQVF